MHSSVLREFGSSWENLPVVDLVVPRRNFFFGFGYRREIVLIVDVGARRIHRLNRRSELYELLILACCIVTVHTHRGKWRRELTGFCDGFDFLGLSVVEETPGETEEEHFVEFVAKLRTRKQVHHLP